LHPFNKRYWLLLFKKETISNVEIECYKGVKEKTKQKYAGLDRGRLSFTGSYVDHSVGSTVSTVSRGGGDDLFGTDEDDDIEPIQLPSSHSAESQLDAAGMSPQASENELLQTDRNFMPKQQSDSLKPTDGEVNLFSQELGSSEGSPIAPERDTFDPTSESRESEVDLIRIES